MRQLELGAPVERPTQVIREREVWFWRADAQGPWFPCLLQPFEGGGGPDVMVYYLWHTGSPQTLARVLERWPGAQWRRGAWPT